MSALVAGGSLAAAVLFGGQHDGCRVPVERDNGTLPDKITYDGDVYHADGTTVAGLPRYSRPQYVGKLTRGKEEQ